MKRVLATLVVMSIAATAAADAADAADGDPWEHGAPALIVPRPKGMALSAGSFTRRICVHGPAGSQSAILETLRGAESAEAIARGALRLPAPDADVSTGALDIYLVDREEPDARVRFGGRDL